MPRTLPSVSDFVFRTESDEPAPTQLFDVDDSLRADDALKRVRRGEYLRYVGTFQNAKQLLSAMGRRLAPPPPAKSPLEAFRAERRARHVEHQTLSRLVVSLDGEYRLHMLKAPDVSVSCRQVWGKPEAAMTVVSLKALLGLQGATEWRRKGLVVPGLTGRLTPHYGVYVPTRTDYIELLRRLPDVEGRTVFDVGTGTGVLSFMLLQRGARSAVGTDIDSRAVVCAQDNARHLSLADRFTALEGPLFPPGRADLVVCNPPWVPEPPKTRIDRAIFDDGSRMLEAFARELTEHLTPGGRGVLLLSNLAELLGLRPPGWLDRLWAEAGLRVASTESTAPTHGKARDTNDPLYEARSREVTTCYVLVPALSP